MEPAIVVGKAYDFALWVLPKVERFPRSQRFTVGDRLIAATLDLLLALVEAAYARRKDALLETAQAKVNTVRYLLRLSKDLRLLPHASYQFAAEALEEIGRMAGGWRRSREREA